jgi:hypothetical protein
MSNSAYRGTTLPALSLGDASIRQLDGLYSLNDLHAAAGGAIRHQPTRFIRLDGTRALIAELGASPEMVTPLRTVNDGQHNGTYACRELVIAYAAWISAAFHLKVIRVFLGRTQADDTERQSKAYAMASEVASQAQRAVFDAVMAGDENWRSARWLFGMRTDHNFGTPKQVTYATAIEPEAYVMSIQRLTQRIASGNLWLPQEEIAELLMACAKRMADDAARGKPKTAVIAAGTSSQRSLV